MTKDELIKRINEEGYGYSDDPNDSVLADFVLKVIDEELVGIETKKKKYRKKAKHFKRKYLYLLNVICELKAYLAVTGIKESNKTDVCVEINDKLNDLLKGI